MNDSTTEKLNCDALVKLLEIQCALDERGYAVATIDVKSKHRNIHGFVHGVVLFALADIGMGFALDHHLGSRKKISTISITSNFIRPAHAQCGGLVSETELINCGRTIATLRTSVRESGGEDCALFTGSFHIAGEIT